MFFCHLSELVLYTEPSSDSMAALRPSCCYEKEMGKSIEGVL